MFRCPRCLSYIGDIQIANDPCCNPTAAVATKSKAEGHALAVDEADFRDVRFLLNNVVFTSPCPLWNKEVVISSEKVSRQCVRDWELIIFS